MKKPETSRHATDPDLVGSNEESSWVVGRNCVYGDSTTAKYRVSIRTPRGWKSYGHFNDLETATYIANIAILVEHCEERYELNKKIGSKDQNELDRWRRVPGHADLERTAAERYKQVQSELAALQEKELESKRFEKIRTAEVRKLLEQEKAEKRKKWQNELDEIRGMSDSQLLALIKATTIYDPHNQVAKLELNRRQGK